MDKTQNLEELKTKTKEMTFEDALKELELIVKKLETGRENLENALFDYEYGNILKNHCDAQLKSAELRVEKILEKADGTTATEEFE